ncbi:uncharacterized protein OCT59_007811 [Rhizophagus irregularis]|uniref:uncharacterized protein n=1 Tax=Rhizophagus irregularis TaxID=588596 RepID=UPI0033176D59|nr:hypothetical protein OCT59_007811 [Rhizophagus irregularis]
MELDWKSYINFPKDSEDTFYTPFSESNSNTSIPPNNNFSVVEPLSNAIESIKLSEPLSNDTSTSDYSTYQYNLTIGNSFDDWESVDRFIHEYCLERGFGYQVYRNDKDLNDHTITRYKSFRCSLSGNYEAQQQIRCTTLVDVHNHELNPTEIAHLNARYRQFNDDMVQDLRFFTDCKVAPIIQLEILKKKHPHHVFRKQDVYNSIYKLRENCKDESPDSGSFLNSLFEKLTEDPNWKVFIRHSVRDNYGRFRNVANALVEDEMASTYT